MICPHCQLPLTARAIIDKNSFEACTYCGRVYQQVEVKGPQFERPNLESVLAMQQCERVQG